MGICAGFAVPHPPLIIPAVGRGEERTIQRTIDAYKKVARRIIELQPEVLVVTSPHAPYYRDAFHITTSPQYAEDLSAFRAPQVRIKAEIADALTTEISRFAQAADIPLAPNARRDRSADHATLIPLYFVYEAYKQAPGRQTPDNALNTFAHASSADTEHKSDAQNENGFPYPIVRLGLSLLPFQKHRDLGTCIAQAIDSLGLRAVFIASGDLSHKLTADGPYGFAPEGPLFDEKFCEIIKSGSLDRLFSFDETFCDSAAECGLRSFQIMAGALDGKTIKSELLSYEGPFGVGYGVAAISVCESDPSNKAADENFSLSDTPDACVALARETIEAYISSGHRISAPESLPEEMYDTRAGTFVSIHKRGELRGCIGTIEATAPTLAEEIINNAIAAATRDPRFPAIQPSELDYLEISVDVLGEPEEITCLEELDPARYGVIVSKQWHRGLLLPDLDGIETAEEQVAIAARKAGLSPSEGGLRLERFEVVRHTRGGEARKA